MQLDQIGNSKALGTRLRQHITESFGDRISFADYMEWALYHPQYGYYATAPSKIGATGDFFTSPHLGADFGELLAEQLVQMAQLLSPSEPFTLVEMGAGQGILAGDILTYLRDRHPAVLAKLEYIIVERAPALIQEQQHQLQAFVQAGLPLRWSSLEDIPLDSITGCFFSNELVDAFPVHQVIRHNAHLQEIYVALAPESTPENLQLAEVVGELSTSRLLEYFQLIDLDLTSDRYPDGYRSEVNLVALDWIAAVAQRLQRGYVLTIDYGYPRDRYYHPMRTEGTLQCYYQHRHHSNPYLYIGQQDITAHVNFTALERQGERCGLETVGLTKQGLFLMALGIGDRLLALSQSNATDSATIQTVLQQRDALQRLIDPMGLGNFGVLIQQKGVSTQEPLIGLKGEL